MLHIVCAGNDLQMCSQLERSFLSHTLHIPATMRNCRGI